MAKDREAASTVVLESYFRLKPLLPVFFRHLSFTPVEDVETLRQRLAPFEAAGAVEIGRQQKCIALGKPVQHTSLGFGPLKDGAVAEQAIDHRFPWVSLRAGTDSLVRLNNVSWAMQGGTRNGGETLHFTASQTQKSQLAAETFAKN